MANAFWGFAATVFLAVALLFWGLYTVWNGSVGRAQTILDRRLKSLSTQTDPGPTLQLHPKRLLSQSAWADKLLLQVPGTKTLDRFLLQTGMRLSVAEALLMVFALTLTTGIAGKLLHAGVVLTVSLMGTSLTLCAWFLAHRRRQRIAQIESQLPDVLDLIARSMQAGHAFTSALLMAANDAKPPLSGELHKVFDEIHFGLDLRQAMSEMAARVASDDLRFFVISVVIQHETGGNLAEVLKSTASLIRERQKIRGVIRVLSGEGRISAWILSLLPFALAAVLNLLNPGFISTLWTQPQGLQMLYVCLTLMVLGIAWMWRLIDIRI